jgi:hypothetical protein
MLNSCTTGLATELGWLSQYSVWLWTGHPGDQGSIPGRAKRIFPVASGAYPASCTVGTGGPFHGAKARLGRDADHSPPSSAEVENE